jgi:cytochrome c551
MKRILFLLLLCIAMTGLSACAAKSALPPSASSPPVHTGNPAEEAKVLYNNFCISCHGGNLTEVKGPNLEKVGERLTEDQIFKQIQKGGNGMPAFKVSMKEEDIRTLARWLAAKK